jgi:hypothetical protein
MADPRVGGEHQGCTPMTLHEDELDRKHDPDGQAHSASQSPDTPPDGCIEGERRKEQAQRRHRRRHPDLMVAAQRAMIRHALLNGIVTADDVRRVVSLPTGVHPTVFGGVPGPLAKAGILTGCHEYRPTTRAAGHCRPLRVWRLLNIPAALDWLARHPERTTAGEEVTL